MSEAVTVPRLMMMTSIVSKESLADTQTDTASSILNVSKSQDLNTKRNENSMHLLVTPRWTSLSTNNTMDTMSPFGKITFVLSWVGQQL